MAALTQVISAGVDDNGSTENGGWANQLHQLVGDGALGNTLGIGGNVSQITNVSHLVGWSTVGLAKWVEMWAGRGTTVGVVTKLVDVEPTLRVGIVTSDFVRDRGWLVLGRLLKVDNSTDTSITTQNSNFTVLVPANNPIGSTQSQILTSFDHYFFANSIDQPWTFPTSQRSELKLGRKAKGEEGETLLFLSWRGIHTQQPQKHTQSKAKKVESARPIPKEEIIGWRKSVASCRLRSVLLVLWGLIHFQRKEEV